MSTPDPSKKITCPSCNASLTARWKNCPVCGAAIPSAGGGGGGMPASGMSGGGMPGSGMPGGMPSSGMAGSGMGGSGMGGSGMGGSMMGGGGGYAAGGGAKPPSVGPGPLTAAADMSGSGARSGPPVESAMDLYPHLQSWQPVKGAQQPYSGMYGSGSVAAPTEGGAKPPGGAPAGGAGAPAGAGQPPHESATDNIIAHAAGGGSSVAQSIYDLAPGGQEGPVDAAARAQSDEDLLSMLSSEQSFYDHPEAAAAPPPPVEPTPPSTPFEGGAPWDFNAGSGAAGSSPDADTDIRETEIPEQLLPPSPKASSSGYRSSKEVGAASSFRQPPESAPPASGEGKAVFKKPWNAVAMPPVDLPDEPPPPPYPHSGIQQSIPVETHDKFTSTEYQTESYADSFDDGYSDERPAPAAEPSKSKAKQKQEPEEPVVKKPASRGSLVTVMAVIVIIVSIGIAVLFSGAIPQTKPWLEKTLAGFGVTLPPSGGAGGPGQKGPLTPEAKLEAEVVELLQQYASNDRGLQMRATGVLQQLGDKATPAIIKALDNEDPAVQAAAAEALATKGEQGHEAIPKLLQLTTSSNSNVQLTAAKTLATFGAPSVSGLRDLTASNDANVRYAAAFALASMGLEAKPATPELFKLISDNSPPVRAEAAKSLAVCGGEMVNELAGLLPTSDNNVRVLVCNVLAGLGEVSAPAGPALIRLLESDNDQVKRASMQALQRIGKQAIDVLIPAIGRQDISVQVASVLVRIGEPSVAPLIAALEDKNPAIRAGAASVLGDLGPTARTAVDPLTKALKDEDQNVRYYANEALRKINK